MLWFDLVYHSLLRSLVLTCGVGPRAEVHADGALGICVLGGVLARRQAHRQRVLGQHREGLECGNGQGGAYRVLTWRIIWLLRALMLACGGWSMNRSAR